MFNGIIYNTGTIKKIHKRRKGINLFLKSDIKLSKKNIGMSICCDGVCLTLISYKNKILEFFLSNETIIRSKFKQAVIGNKINLELPLKKGQGISGHICQGHVDTTGILKNVIKHDEAYVYKFHLKRSFVKYLVDKASILINGVSLTISNIKNNTFEVWLIPHTVKLTNLSNVKKNELVNIEIDILSKYVRKFINEKK